MKTLILTVSAGNGHNSTAKRLKDKILNENKSNKVEIIDVYKAYASKLKRWTMEDGYELICNKAVCLYNYFFRINERLPYEKRNKYKIHKEVQPLLYGLIKKIYDYKPDLIIATHIFCAVALSDLKKYYHIPAKIICMTLDYSLSPFWQCCSKGLDKLFLTGEYMIDSFKNIGFNDDQLIVSGIPVASSFSTQSDKLEARKALNLNENLFTIIVMKASFFPIKINKLFKQFKLIKNKIQIIIVNGNNPKAKKAIDNKIKKAKLKHIVINLGFTNKISDYFKACDLVLGKAGGLTTTETINAELPSLIINKLPQQEIYNRDYLVNNNCALSVNKNTIAQKINYLIENKDEYKKLKFSIKKVKIDNSLNIFYNTFKTFPTANYSNIVFTDNKKQVIKNVSAALKNEIVN